MTPVVDPEYRRTPEARLRAFVVTALATCGVAATDATMVADVLVAADLRGIESHGVARLVPFYVDRIRSGALDPSPRETIDRETATTLAIDAGNGLGHPASTRAMRAVIEKAKRGGVAFATVRNSNHFGIAGFYAMLALEHDMIGIASTNSVRYGAPTYGRDVMLGTNPWAYAVPASEEPAFVLDFATTTVPRGKLEVFKRKERPLKPGWAIDVDGNQTLDADAGLLGALLPLGGLGVESGGHKGYGLGLLVDLMCGVLGGGRFGTDLPLPNSVEGPGMISHFFGAIAIDGFRDVADFRRDVDRELRQFKATRTTPGDERVFVAGEIEHEKTLVNRARGVPIHPKVWAQLEALASELALPFDLAR